MGAQRVKAAHVQVPADDLMNWLQFEGGKVWGVSYDPKLQVISVTIEHPDFQATEGWQMLPSLRPVYERQHDEAGNILGQIRINPQKGKGGQL